MWVGIVGIIGELVCDAVIWEASSSLWIIADNDLKAALALAGPRNIHATEDRLVIKSALERFPRTPYDLSLPPMTDRKPGQLELLEPSSFLVEHLIVVLSVLSGWKLQSVQGDIPKTRLPAAITLLTMLQDEKSSRDAPVPVINLGQVSGLFGVKIVVPFEETILRDAAYALAQALNKIHIETDVDLPAPYNNIKTNLVTGNAVHIIIGVEP